MSSSVYQELYMSSSDYCLSGAIYSSSDYCLSGAIYV